MREQIFKCKKGDYYARVWEDESGKVFAADAFTDLCQKAHGFNRGMNGEKKCEQREL